MGSWKVEKWRIGCRVAAAPDMHGPTDEENERFGDSNSSSSSSSSERTKKKRRGNKRKEGARTGKWVNGVQGTNHHDESPSWEPGRRTMIRREKMLVLQCVTEPILMHVSLSVCISICISVCLSVCMSVLSVCLVCLSCLPVLSICLSVYLVHLSCLVCLSCLCCCSIILGSSPRFLIGEPCHPCSKDRVCWFRLTPHRPISIKGSSC